MQISLWHHLTTSGAFLSVLELLSSEKSWKNWPLSMSCNFLKIIFICLKTWWQTPMGCLSFHCSSYLKPCSSAVSKWLSFNQASLLTETAEFKINTISSRLYLWQTCNSAFLHILLLISVNMYNKTSSICSEINRFIETHVFLHLLILVFCLVLSLCN